MRIDGDRPRLPSYLKTSVPISASYNKIKKDLRGLGLQSVIHMHWEDVGEVADVSGDSVVPSVRKRDVRILDNVGEETRETLRQRSWCGEYPQHCRGAN